MTPGAPDRILLFGTVAMPDVAFEGQVLVEGSLITCVAPALGCQGQVGAAGATIIDMHGVIAPGLVDTHNHILFDIFDDTDWLPLQAYTNHKDWTTEVRYQAMLDVKQCLEDASQGKPTDREHPRGCADRRRYPHAGRLRLRAARAAREVRLSRVARRRWACGPHTPMPG